jgi:hypothetical protein
MWHELFIDKLVPQYGWGDQPPDCKGEDLNVSSFLVVYNTEPFCKQNWMPDSGFRKNNWMADNEEYTTYCIC